MSEEKGDKMLGANCIEKIDSYIHNILQNMIPGNDDIVIIKSKKEPHVSKRNGGRGSKMEDWGYITVLEHGEILGNLSPNMLKEIFYFVYYFADKFSNNVKKSYKIISRQTALNRCKEGKGFNPELHDLATSSWFFVNEVSSKKGTISDIVIDIDDGHMTIKGKQDIWQSPRIDYSDNHVIPTILGAGILAKKPEKHIADIVPLEYPFFIPEGVIVLEKIK